MGDSTAIGHHYGPMDAAVRTKPFQNDLNSASFDRAAASTDILHVR